MVECTGNIEAMKYEACEIGISQIKSMLKNGTWNGSLEEEEVLYNLEKNLYSKKYAEKIKVLLKR